MSISTLADLLAKKCQRREVESTPAEVAAALTILKDWRFIDARIERQFDFKDYTETLAFVNAIATIIHAQDHHPELTVTYNRCVVKFHTHSVNHGTGGISENDFICAAQIDAVFDQSPV